jgi:FdhD protein
MLNMQVAMLLVGVTIALYVAAIIITSRASFEMVQKTAALGIGMLAAVSAPTAAAIRLAERLNVTLIGFLRAQSCVIYTHSQTEHVI